MDGASGTSEAKVNWVARAVALSWFTILYNLVEGAVSIAFGVSDESVSLAGFGVDSLIEVGSAMLVLWRFRKEEKHEAPDREREKRATLGIGLLFVLLAVVTLIASAVQLVGGRHPETTLPGLIVSILSLSFMFFLWRSKLKVAAALNSATVSKDASCSLACIKLSIVLLCGSLLFVAFPYLWWADSIAAIVLSGLIGREGWETIEATRKADFTGGCGCAHD